MTADDAETAVVGHDGPESPPRTDVPAHIGRYVVLEEVGRGGMGRVLRAYDPKLQREVALKEVRGDVLALTGAQRLVAEARAMAKLSHPNVVAVYDVEEIGPDRVVLVMEYVAGQTLSTWLKQAPRPWHEIVANFREAGRGLAAAHAASLLHRDFKPSNALIAERGVKVTDFGLAKLDGLDSSGRSAEDDAPAEVTPLESGSSATDRASTPALGSEGLTQDGMILGTPLYMAPEQHRGEVLTAAADQYAFCVALWQALCGQPPFSGDRLGAAKAQGPPAWPGGPTPRRVADALRRGLAALPVNRWPTMDALLDALRYDPVARRNRWLLATASATVFGAAIVGGYVWSTERAQRCTESAALSHLEGAWDDAVAADVHVALVGIGASYASAVWARTEQSLDAYASEWTRMHVETCEATSVRGEQSREVMDLRMACLHRAKVELQAVTQVLADADARTVQKAHELTDGLRPLQRCADVHALQADVEPPLPHEAQAVEALREHLALARAAMKAGQSEKARREIDAAKAGLSEVEYGPVRTEVASEEGHVLERFGEYAQAEAVLRDALRLAAQWRQMDAMQSTAAFLIFVVGDRQRRFDEGLRYADLATGLAVGDPEREARVDSAVASVRFAAGAYDEAGRLHERALATTEKALGPEHVRVGATLNNLALVRFMQGRYEEAAALHERALAIWTKALGPEHPDLPFLFNGLANARYVMGAYAEAAALHERSLVVMEKALGRDHPNVAMVLNNLGHVRNAMGARAEAEALLERALAIREQKLGSEHPEVAVTLVNLAHVRLAAGAYDEARARARRSLAIREKVLGPEHGEVAESLDALAEVHHATRAYDEAVTFWERSLSVRENAFGPDHPYVASSLIPLARVALAQKRAADAVVLAERAVSVRETAEVTAADLAIARLVLAQALLAAGGPKTRAMSLARSARDTLRETADRHREALAEAEALLRDAP